MSRTEGCRTVALLVTALWGDAASAQAAGDCYAKYGLTRPPAQDSSVAVVDASTFLTPVQAQQARELLMAEVRPGRAFTLYVFARGVGQESLQRALHFSLQPYLNAPWKVGAELIDKVNDCVHKNIDEVGARASVMIDELLRGYVAYREGESPIAQAFAAAVAAHPTASRFLLVSNGVQHERGGFSLYDPQAGATQSVRVIDLQTDADTLVKRAKPAMTRAMSVGMFPVGQVEPGADGQMHQRRKAAEVTSLVALWRLYFTKAGAGRVSVTSFVPLD